jgi:hypothetical protein
MRILKKTKKHEQKVKHIQKRSIISNFHRNIIYTKQNDLCNICLNKLGVERILDHIQPLFLGGADKEYNYQAICGSCNKWKTYEFDHFLEKYLKLKNYDTDKNLTNFILSIQKRRYFDLYQKDKTEYKLITKNNFDNIFYSSIIASVISGFNNFCCSLKINLS